MEDSTPLIKSHMPGTLVQLRKRTGLARSTVARCIQRLHAAGDCHVLTWVESAGGPNAPYLAVYKLGKGRDAAPPVYSRPKEKGLPQDSTARARMKALAEADRAARVRDPRIWWLFDINTVF
jgi:hypothetical protein